MSLRAKEPFRFYTRLTLPVMTGIKASNIGELLERLKEVPESVIYQHTYRFLQEHQYLVPEPPNDFAYWVTHILQDEALGERLMTVDTIRFKSLNDLRQALVVAVEDHLKKNPSERSVSKGKEFHFMGAIRFSLPTPHQAWDLVEFGECLRHVSISSIYLHIFEACLRPPLGINDFSLWLETEIHEKKLAKKIASLDPYTHSFEGLRSMILNFVEESLLASS